MGNDRNIPQIFASEYRFCLLLWAHEPIRSGELAALCREQLGWKPTTTYTVIKRLSERGVLKNENAVVTSLVTKDEVQTAQVQALVDTTFGGSVPLFLAAFTRGRHLSAAETNELQALIDRERAKGDASEEGDGPWGC